ncbi:MAG: low specificity L-threonine aldolase, partial [Actinomycetota bacterium]
AVLPDAHPIAPPTSNIVYADGVDAPAIVAGLRERGILAGSMDPTTLRMVTHRDVDTVGITRATDALKTVLAS